MKLLVFYYLCQKHVQEAIERYGLASDYFLIHEKYSKFNCDVMDCRQDAVCRDIGYPVVLEVIKDIERRNSGIVYEDPLFNIPPTPYELKMLGDLRKWVLEKDNG